MASCVCRVFSRITYIDSREDVFFLLTQDLMKQEQTEQTLRHEPSCISGSAASDKEDEQYLGHTNLMFMIFYDVVSLF